MRNKPRKAAKLRWLDGAPDFVWNVQDHPKYVDRYTIWFEPYEYGGQWLFNYLGCSDQPGPVSMWGEIAAHDASRRGRNRIAWRDLPQSVRDHAVSRYTSD